MANRKQNHASPNRRSVHLADADVQMLAGHALASSLYPVSAGFFQRSSGHFIRRQNPLSEHIYIHCISGCGWYKSPHFNSDVVAGQILFCPAGLPHAYGADSDDPWTIHWAHFSGSLVPEWYKILGITPQASLFSLGEDSDALALQQNLLEILDSEEGLAPLLLASSLLSHFFSRLLASSQKKQQRRFGAQAVIDHIRADSSRHWSLEELAQIAGLSVSQFSRRFRETTGSAPLEYLQRLRVQKACTLLATSRKSIGAIATEVGYPDAYYFSRIFKKRMNMTPRRHREHTQGVRGVEVAWIRQPKPH